MKTEMKREMKTEMKIEVKIEITKQLMEAEARRFLGILFSLPEIEKVAIKEVVIASIQDEKNIIRALEECYHDKYSDLDFYVWVSLSPQDFYGQTPIYKKYFSRLQMQDKILGIIFQERTDDIVNKEGMRICLKTGVRIDFTCFCSCDINKDTLPQDDFKNSIKQKDEGNFFEDWNLEKVDSFWFIAIQALGKLMRNDYLIACHLSNVLVQEGLGAQMKIRDNQKNINSHRYGNKDKLEFFMVDKSGANEFKVQNDNTYNYIVEQVYQAVVSYDRLITGLNHNYVSKLELFLEIWRSYVK